MINKHNGYQQSSSGFTMIELCVAAFLVVLVSLSASVLIRNSVEASIEKRALQQETQIGMSVMSRLRNDILNAQTIEVDTKAIKIDESIVWEYREAIPVEDSTMVRVIGGSEEDFSKQYSSEANMFILCGDPCFVGYDVSGAVDTDNPRRIELIDFRVGHDGINKRYSNGVVDAKGARSQFDTDEMVFHWKMGVEFE